MAESREQHTPGNRNNDAYWKQIQENLNQIAPASKNYGGGKMKPVGNPVPIAKMAPPETFNGGKKHPAEKPAN